MKFKMLKENEHYVKGSKKKGSYKYVDKGITCLYKIENDITGHFYIGSTLDLATRLSHHFSDLKRGVHACRYLQDNFNEYGYENFSFGYVEFKKDELYEKEVEELNKFNGNPLLLNSSTENNSWILNEKNAEQVKEWKIKISEKAKLRIGFNNPFYGKSHSDETKRKLRSAHIDKENPNCWKSIVINGIRYNNLKEASKDVNVSIATISHRVRSNNLLFVNWYEYSEEDGFIGIKDERVIFEPNSKPSGVYEIEGIIYLSKNDILEKYNLKSSTFIYRLNSKNFEDWRKLN